jgi:hypothetical protein
MQSRAAALGEEELMNGTGIGFNRFVGRGLAAPAVLAMLLAMGAPEICQARASGQKTFSTPQQATAALFLAIRNNDHAAMVAILGARKESICPFDNAQDRREHARFVEKYEQMHRLVREPDGTTVLYIGAENWPFPFPVVSSKGAWRFDAAAGMREILFRRVGENETAAVQTCRELVNPHGPRTASLQNGPMLMHGYYFRSLTAESRAAASNGGNGTAFAYIAYPAEYRSSGVMTFIVKRDGVVYAKDLGPSTTRRAKAMSGFSPNRTWTVEK